ncbi:MAG: FtsQ-type POTRA domain-containing protein [Clostridiales bacterium]|nr:FtsQ-type POTRA domain-containing protein [Clostridiales bacterium]
MRNKRLIVLLSVVLALIVIIVATGATFLVRNVEAYNYYGYTDGGLDYDSYVIEAADIKRNSSIFFVDEEEVKNKVERAFPNVGVINVERKFPDRVSVNYVVYERMFQYENDGRYYRCYSSCRIGESSAEAAGDVFNVKTNNPTATAVGAYFQSAGSYDRKIIETYISVMRNKGLIDRQISSHVRFIDLTREGYVYIRMSSGCSIEIHGSVDDFAKFLERGFDIFADTKAEINKISGLIRVWEYKGGDGDMRSSYTAVGAEIGKREDGSIKYYSDELYYLENYGENA